MCGIIGIVGEGNVVSRVVEGLKRLEYRGYDSAGISVVSGNNEMKTLKRAGKIVNLENAINDAKNFAGNFAIGHTRWATHGKPNENNSHPHLSKNLSVVHNGIIENHQELKDKLIKEGYKFISDTDSEIIPHLISYYFLKLNSIQEAIFNMLKEIKGTFAIAVLFSNKESNLLVIAKKGSPLLIGYKDHTYYVASDYSALSNLVDRISYLDDGDTAFISSKDIAIYDIYRNKIQKDIRIMESDYQKITKEGYDHFMLKEIFEQPRVIQDTLDRYLDRENYLINLPNFPFDLSEVTKISIIACGTSYYAGMATKYLIESTANIDVEVSIASEFRYHNPLIGDKNLFIFISQSGETADTIAALKFAKSQKKKTLSIVNVDKSTISHLSDITIKMIAGIEIGVASTKTFTGQIIILSLIALKIAEAKKVLTQKKKKELIDSIINSSDKISKILEEDALEKIKEISRFLIDKNNLLYIGRGVSYVTALEGSLKLRELSYINANAVSAGELKHGTIALVDKNFPVIAIAPDNNLLEKSLSNIQEIVARDGDVILIGNKTSIDRARSIISFSFEIPIINNMIEEILFTTISTQLIAYYTACFKGNDVDQPRNLAKSVTVE